MEIVCDCSIVLAWGFPDEHSAEADKILQEMEKADLINFNKQGRLKLLNLTKKGYEVAENIDKIRTII